MGSSTPARYAASCRLATGLAVIASAVVAATMSCAIDPTPRVVKPGCPAIIPGTSGATEDFPDLLVWHSTIHLRPDTVQGELKAALPDPIRLDSKITSIGCSLADPSSGRGRHTDTGQWPDRTATGLPAGTVIYAVRDVAPSCALIAMVQQERYLYLAVNRDWTPRC